MEKFLQREIRACHRATKPNLATAHAPPKNRKDAIRNRKTRFGIATRNSNHIPAAAIVRIAIAPTENYNA